MRSANAMLRPLTVILLAALLAAPLAQAGWLDREVVIHVAPERVGDRLSYETLQSTPQLDAQKGGDRANTMVPFEARTQRVVLVEGASSAVDAYGISRATVAYRIDLASEGAVEWATRCHRLAEGTQTVRIDHLGAGMPEPATDKGAPERGMTMTARPAVEFDAGACTAGLALAGRELAPGTTLRLEELDATRAWGEALDLVSAPATAAAFEGRDALVFVFQTDGGRLTYTLADGLPAFAERVHEMAGEANGIVERTTLVGYAPGNDVTILASGSATLPVRNPNAEFARPDPLALDDDAYSLAFPYADAYAAILSDPSARLGEWLDAHPDAILAFAMYDRDARDASLVGLSTRGSWNLGFADETAGMSYSIVRVEGASTPLGPIAAPTTTDRVTGSSEFKPDGSAALPAEIARSASLATLAAAHGLDATELTSLQYVARDTLHLQLSTKGEGDEETHLVLDPARAAATMGYTTSRAQGGALGFFTGGVAAERTGFAAIEAPTTLATGAAVAATGLGLLLWLVLLPLFTRLRRDSLLDNPVRARLYERIRAEPGIHRAELVDFAGIGEGATRHHLAQMTKHRLILETAQDGFVRYFAAGEVPPPVARREALLRAGSHREVYELYAREPTLSLRDAGARLGMSAPSVHRAKKKLEAAGLLPAALDAAGFVAEA